MRYSILLCRRQGDSWSRKMEKEEEQYASTAGFSAMNINNHQYSIPYLSPPQLVLPLIKLRQMFPAELSRPRSGDYHIHQLNPLHHPSFPRSKKPRIHFNQFTSWYRPRSILSTSTSSSAAEGGMQATIILSIMSLNQTWDPQYIYASVRDRCVAWGTKL